MISDIMQRLAAKEKLSDDDMAFLAHLDLLTLSLERLFRDGRSEVHEASQITDNLGTMRAGAFVAASAGTEPEDANFSGTHLSADLRTAADGVAARIAEILNGVTQFAVGNGKATAGAGAVTLDEGGIQIEVSDVYEDARSYKFVSGSTVASAFKAAVDTGLNIMTLVANAMTGRDASVTIAANSPSGNNAALALQAYEDGGTAPAIFLDSFATGPGDIVINANFSNADTSINSVNNQVVTVDASADTVYIGGGTTDAVQVNGTGHLKLLGEATAFDDYQIPAGNIKAPAADAPATTVYRGCEVYAFAAGATNVLYFTVQLPHRWKPGTTVYPHFHVAYPDGTTGVTRWQLSYSWANINGTFPTETTDTKNFDAPAVANKHSLHEFTSIDGTGKTESSVLLCSLSRLGANVNDTYANVVYLTSIDLHIEIEKFGADTAP